MTKNERWHLPGSFFSSNLIDIDLMELLWDQTLDRRETDAENSNYERSSFWGSEHIFGAPDVSVTVRPRTAVSWVKVETEYYAAPSTQRQMSEDGNVVLSETQGIKFKQHKLTCIIRIESDATRRISLVELLGNRRACGLYLQKVTLPARFG